MKDIITYSCLNGSMKPDDNGDWVTRAEYKLLQEQLANMTNAAIQAHNEHSGDYPGFRTVQKIISQQGKL